MTQSPASTIGTKSTDKPFTNRRDLLAGVALAGLAIPLAGSAAAKTGHEHHHHHAAHHPELT
ncbi:MAG: hypothetical protein PVF41_08140, partial [Methyloceanibacter sp.]